MDKSSKIYRPFAVMSGIVTMGMATLFALGENIRYKKCLDAERRTTVPLVRDTVDIDASSAIHTSMSAGTYDVWTGVTNVHCFRDTTGSEQGQKSCAMLNEVLRFSDYHEIRHARNDIYMRHIRNGGSRRIYAADELSGRMAEMLARASRKPELPSGDVRLDINFNLGDGVDAAGVCSLLLGYVIDDMMRVDGDYRADYDKMSKSLLCRLRAIGLLREETVLNRLLTFRINGADVNVLQIASPSVRDRVIAYLDSYDR